MKQSLVLILLVVLGIACQPTFIPDPKIPGLPAITQDGQNDGGCLVNDSVWLLNTIRITESPNVLRPLNLLSYPDGDSIVLYFNGRYKNPNLILAPPDGFYIVLKNVLIKSDSDLIKLKHQVFNINNDNAYCGLSYFTEKQPMEEATGQIKITQVAKVYSISINTGPGPYDTTKMHHPYVFSGQFNMNFYDSLSHTSYNFTEGRFDVTLLENDYSFAVIK